MLSIKAFAPNTTLHKNDMGVDNPIGELSTRSLTYTKEKGVYIDRDVDPNLSLVTFTVTKNNAFSTVPVSMVNKILQVIKGIYDFAATKAGIQLDGSDYIDELYDNYDDLVGDITLGAIVSDGDLWVPERIGFSVLGEETNQVMVWLADDSFQRQFPDSEIVVVPPVDNLDDFFMRGVDVEAFLSEITPTMTAQRIQEARGRYPESFLRIDMFDYHDPVTTTRIVPSSWGILVYGISGNNIDNIKDAIIEYILDNSSHGRDEWAEIFPDIFKRNEFVICPLWDEYAIPNKTTVAGMYSPVNNLAAMTNYLIDINKDYKEAHIKAHASATGFPFRSLMVAMIGHDENREARFSLRDVFPDWINTNTTQDFNRMTPETKAFSLTLSEAVFQAEKFTEFDSIPENYMKVIRNDRLFLTFSVDGINYLVLCKNLPTGD